MKWFLLMLAVLALLTGCGSDNGSSGSSNSDEMTVDLAAQNGSSESGTATLTAVGGKTKVVVDLDNPPMGTPQPAHIHKGSCKDLDPNPAYGLQNVVGGMSTTEVDEPLKDLEKGSYAINVHKSGAEIKTYVACGDIGSGSSDGGSDGGYGGGY
jgi:uncharacterized protein YceK